MRFHGRHRGQSKVWGENWNINCRKFVFVRQTNHWCWFCPSKQLKYCYHSPYISCYLIPCIYCKGSFPTQSLRNFTHGVCQVSQLFQERPQDFLPCRESNCLHLLFTEVGTGVFHVGILCHIWQICLQQLYSLSYQPTSLSLLVDDTVTATADLLQALCQIQQRF